MNRTGCDTELSERAVARLFFDEGCVATMQSDELDCPMTVLNEFIEHFIQPLRFDAMVLSFLGMVGLVMLMQLGGIPRAQGRIGDCLFASFTTTLVCQWLTQFFILKSFLEIFPEQMRVYNYTELLPRKKKLAPTQHRHTTSAY